MKASVKLYALFLIATGLITVSCSKDEKTDPIIEYGKDELPLFELADALGSPATEVDSNEKDMGIIAFQPKKDGQITGFAVLLPSTDICEILLHEITSGSPKFLSSASVTTKFNETVTVSIDPVKVTQGNSYQIIYKTNDYFSWGYLDPCIQEGDSYFPNSYGNIDVLGHGTLFETIGAVDESDCGYMGVVDIIYRPEL